MLWEGRFEAEGAESPYQRETATRLRLGEN